MELDEQAWRTGTLWVITGRQGWLLPAHVAIAGDDFMPAGWCGACETCRGYPAPLVCLACSYEPGGHPYDTPTNWPCPVVCRHAALRQKVQKAALLCGACDAGLPQSCTCVDARPLVLELMREVEMLAAKVSLAVDSRHTLG